LLVSGPYNVYWSTHKVYAFCVMCPCKVLPKANVLLFLSLSPPASAVVTEMLRILRYFWSLSASAHPQFR